MRKSFISPFKLIKILTENRTVLIKYKHLSNCVSLLWTLYYTFMGFVDSMKDFLSKIHPKILTFKNIYALLFFKWMMSYLKSFYQPWNCWISFKSQAKWMREEGNQREQFISSWERAVSAVMSGLRQSWSDCPAKEMSWGRNYIVRERVLRRMFL